MIGTLIGILILCIVAGFVFWAAQQLIALIPMGEPFVTIVRILMYAIILVIVIYALILLLGLAGVHVPSIGSVR